MQLVTEAVEAAKRERLRAAANLRHQVMVGETQGVISMYEDAAVRLGLTYAECNAITVAARDQAKRDI